MVDTHCHLYDHEAFPDPEIVVAKAADAGVNRLIVIGIDVATSEAAIKLADRFPSVFAAVGFHPNHAYDYSEANLEVITNLAKHPKVVAIGEIGLDYHWDFATPEQQRAALDAQLDLAESINKPIVFHCREAYDELLATLEARGQSLQGVFHCFAGDQSHAQRVLDLGCHLGFDGPLTYKKNEALREIAKHCPEDRLLIETDAPYLSPEPLRGKKNEPANVALVLAKLAEVRETSLVDMEAITTRNAEALFGLV